MTEPGSPATFGLPFASWRPYQYEGVERIIHAREADVILVGPPGCGKSGIAVAAAKALGSPTTILCSTKALQDQYRDTLGIPLVKGRENFECPEGHSAAPGCAPKGGCRPDIRPRCEYAKQRNAGAAASIVCTNYAYWIRSAKTFTRPVMIADECDLVPEHFTSGAALSLSELDDTDNPLSRLYQWAGDHGRLCRSPCDAFPTDARVIFDGLYLRPFGQKRIWMSATVLPDYLAAELGLGEPRDYAVIDLPSFFPPSSRPVIFRSTVRMNNNVGNEELDTLTDAIDNIIAYHLPQKGIIHAPSHRLCQQIIGRSRYRPLMITHGDDTNSPFAKFRNQEVGILVSPSAGRGMDFPYDAARWQIITKLPFPDLASPIVQARRRTNELWYELITLNAVLQTAGRVCRAADDTGATYILDSNYRWLRGRHKDKLPQYFKQAEIWE